MEKFKYLCEKINWRPKNKKSCEYNKYILGITSLWLIIPFIYGILHIIEKKNFNIIFILLTLWIGLCCIISTLLGLNKLGSIIHIIDIKCAEILFIILCVYFGLDIGNKIDIKMKIIFPLLVVLFYVSSVFFYNKKYNNLSTLSHLTFRFIGFWWCFFAVYSNIIDWETILILSIAYYIHILIEIQYINKLYKFKCNQHYIIGCSKTFSFILLCLLFHILHINYLKIIQ